MLRSQTGPDQPVQPGLVAPDVVDDEERREPVLGLEGCSLPEVTGTGPNACEGEISESININTANIVNIKLGTKPRDININNLSFIVYQL